MFFEIDVTNAKKISTIIDNMESVCIIEHITLEGTQKWTELAIKYQIKEEYLIKIEKEYSFLTRSYIKDVIADFITDNDNIIYYNLKEFVEVLLGLKYDNYCYTWIENYFCHDNYFLGRFKELHNKNEV